MGLLLVGPLGTGLIRLSWIKVTSTIIVPDQYSTIQEAVHNALNEDTVFVRAGIYFEHVTIDKSISLIGESKYTTTVDGGGTGSIVCVSADDVTITGFTIENSGRTINGTVPDAGISLSNMFNCSVFGNILADNYVGIFTRPSTNSLFADNIIISSHIGIDINNQSTYNIISGNRLQENNVSIHVHYADFNSFLENNLTDSPIGVAVLYSYSNTFYHNILFNNIKQVSVLKDYTNLWDNSVEGNYWSDYNGNDSNDDGIGDTPYIINEGNHDNFPLMSPYLYCDVNHDSNVDIFDISLVIGAFGEYRQSYGWFEPYWYARKDVNEDSLVDISDIYLVISQYGNS